MKKVKEFMNVQHAEDYKAKMEKLKDSLKIPFFISVPVSIIIIWIFNYATSTDNISPVQDTVLGIIFFICLAASAFIWIFTIVKGGKIFLSILAKIIFCGFIIIPLPFSLFVGLIISALALYALVFIPWIVLIAVWFNARKEIKRADEYIYYNAPAEMNQPVSE